MAHLEIRTLLLLALCLAAVALASGEGAEAEGAGGDGGSAGDGGDGGEKPGLREEADVETLRAKAIEQVEEKFEKPLEKLKVKELKQLLSERGVSCTACSEKYQLLKTVRESLHLPVKPDLLKKINIPDQAEDEELQKFIKELKQKQEKENELKEKMKAAGMNTDGINFGGFSGFSPDQMEKVIRNLKKNPNAKPDL